MTATRKAELPTTTIEYTDTGGDGPTLVFLHGLLMNGSLWDAVVDDLREDFRCVVPTLPLGAHTVPTAEDTDLSLRGQAGIVAEFLEALDLHEATLVGNDTGGAVVQVLAGGPELPGHADTGHRIARIVLVSCDAFDNFPPGLTGRTLFLTGKLPPALFGGFMQQMRLKPARRMPISFGWLTKRGDQTVRGWLDPLLSHPAVRADAVRALRAMSKERPVLRRASEGLAGFERPALVAWASKDRVMPPQHGRRLAQILPDAKLVEIEDSYTLVPLDRPRELAQAIRAFMTGPSD